MHNSTRAVLDAIKDSGLSDLAVAAKAKVSPGSLMAWRKRNVSPSVDKLGRVAAVVGLRIIVAESVAKP